MGSKFEDANTNGRLDTDEPLLGGWPILVRDDAGQVVYETTTVSDTQRPDFGTWYLFKSLPALFDVDLNGRERVIMNRND